MIIIIAVLATLCLCVTLYLVFVMYGPQGSLKRKQFINSRMASYSNKKQQVSILKKKTSYSANPKLNKMLGRSRFMRSLSEKISQTDLKITALKLLIIGCVFAIIAYVAVSLLTSSLSYSLLAGIICIALPFIYLNHKRSKYLQTFSEQLPGALGMMASSLKVGHTVENAIRVVTKTAQDPIAREFKLVESSLQVGQPLIEAIRQIYNRLKDPDVQILVTAIAIQEKTGGNLSEIISNLEQTIRDRFAIRREIKVLSAEGKISMLVMVFLPAAIIIPQFIFMRDAILRFWAVMPGKLTYLVASLIVMFSIFLASRMVKIKERR